MSKFNAGDKVAVIRTERTGRLMASTIGGQYILDKNQAEELNDGFPAELGRYSFMPTDLEIRERGYPSYSPVEDPDVAEAKRMAAGGSGSDLDLDRMERQMEGEYPGDYPKPSNRPDPAPVKGYVHTQHPSQTSPDVKAMREELKGAPNLSLYRQREEIDAGVRPVIIVRSKKKRRKLVIAVLPEAQPIR